MIDWFYDIVQEKFTITDIGELKKHLGICYRQKTDSEGEQYVEATMVKLADEIKKSYKQLLKKKATKKAATKKAAEAEKTTLGDIGGLADLKKKMEADTKKKKK